MSLSSKAITPSLVVRSSLFRSHCSSFSIVATKPPAGFSPANRPLGNRIAGSICNNVNWKENTSGVTLTPNRYISSSLASLSIPFVFILLLLAINRDRVCTYCMKEARGMRVYSFRVCWCFETPSTYRRGTVARLIAVLLLIGTRKWTSELVGYLETRGIQSIKREPIGVCNCIHSAHIQEKYTYYIYTYIYIYKYTYIFFKSMYFSISCERHRRRLCVSVCLRKRFCVIREGRGRPFGRSLF